MIKRQRPGFGKQTELGAHGVRLDGRGVNGSKGNVVNIGLEKLSCTSKLVVARHADDLVRTQCLSGGLNAAIIAPEMDTVSIYHTGKTPIVVDNARNLEFSAPLHDAACLRQTVSFGNRLSTPLQGDHATLCGLVNGIQ